MQVNHSYITPGRYLSDDSRNSFIASHPRFFGDVHRPRVFICVKRRRSSIGGLSSASGLVPQLRSCDGLGRRTTAFRTQSAPCMPYRGHRTLGIFFRGACHGPPVVHRVPCRRRYPHGVGAWWSPPHATERETHLPLRGHPSSRRIFVEVISPLCPCRCAPRLHGVAMHSCSGLCRAVIAPSFTAG